MTHPPRGTCEPACPMFGVCHCGCGQTANIADSSNATSDRVRGMPYVYRRGHSPHIDQIRHAAYKHNVPIEKLRPLLYWLLERYTWRQVEAFTGVGHGHLSRMLGTGRKPIRTVRPTTANNIVQAVLAHKRKRSVWSVYEVEPTLIPTAWRAEIDDARRERARVNQRDIRSGTSATPCITCGRKMRDRAEDRCYACRDSDRDRSLSATNRRRWGSGIPPLVRSG